MNYKLLLVLILSYSLAFSVNFMPSIKHPDSNMNMLNLLVSLLFVLILFLYARKGNKIFRIFTIAGVTSGIIVFVITRFEHLMYNNVLLDMIASIQYPLYLIFITPLFGGNIAFGMSYGAYGLLMSLVYGLVFIVSTGFKKKNVQYV
ncbi:hypothetical protein [Virgibacillus doumboii]|uniref:hypothetical protein n=1 Tax=Virgibacillus doumboii TaxID=2697503 RepID=UPI0013DFD994|nr:hypothetical protein [Virgibacillus doumboii]